MDGVGLAHFGLPNPPELNLCPAPGLGDVGQGSREGSWGWERCWGALRSWKMLPHLANDFSAFYLKTFHPKTQPVGPVQTSSRQPAGAGAFPDVLRGGSTFWSPAYVYFSFPSRNKETSRDEFIFYSKRLMRLLIEHALSFLPFQVGLGLGDHALSSPVFQGTSLAVPLSPELL